MILLLSIASKATATRSSTVTTTLRRRLPTAAAPGPAPSSARLVISRRAWHAHEKTLPKAPRPKMENPDNKPWPQSMRIAGAVAGSIFIPYASLWFLTSNPTMRDRLEDYLPMDQFRTHFGEPERDSKKGYGEKEEEELDVGYYQFPGERSFRERTQERTVQAMDETTVTANLYILGDQEVQQTQQVPAALRVNRKSLSELVGNTEHKPVAVDFEEDTMEASSSTTTTSSTTTSSLTDDMGLLQPFDENPTVPLLQETHTFSTWYYHRNYQQQQQEAPRTSDADMEHSRLEYTIAELEKSLKDPNCTRDIDAMTEELRQTKRDLSRLKWKRRLGL
jgi:hypothetical protein